MLKQSGVILSLFLSGCAGNPPKEAEPPSDHQRWLEPKLSPPREIKFSDFPGGAALNQAGRRHVLARLDEGSHNERQKQKKLAWTKYCHNRIDMTDEDWRAIRNDMKPGNLRNCDSRPLQK